MELPWMNQQGNQNTVTQTAAEENDLERLRNLTQYKPEVFFTPEEFIAGRQDKYVNLPVLPGNVTLHDIHTRVENSLKRKIDKPRGLEHKAFPPGHDVVMGLAAYPEAALGIFKLLVGSLCSTGYDGHIILGVHADISDDEQDYLKKMDVTFYKIEFVKCDASIMGHVNDEKNVVRGLCSKGLETLKLEWARFEMARQWLHACDTCTGWALVMDTRDIFFQADPFKSLPEPESAPHDLLFIEEISRHTCPKREDPKRYYVLGNSFYTGSAGSCYGAYHERFADRPVICSGTIIGTREGMDRFLAVYVDEFIANNAKGMNCRSPSTTDQHILQVMYYNGMFGYPEKTKTLPWGTGPINTIGHACVDHNTETKHSAKDMIEFDKDTGLILK